MTLAELDQRFQGWLQEDDLAWDRAAAIAMHVVGAVRGGQYQLDHFRPPRRRRGPATPERLTVEQARADLADLKARIARSRGE